MGKALTRGLRVTVRGRELLAEWNQPTRANGFGALPVAHTIQGPSLHLPPPLALSQRGPFWSQPQARGGTCAVTHGVVRIHLRPFTLFHGAQRQVANNGRRGETFHSRGVGASNVILADARF